MDTSKLLQAQTDMLSAQAQVQGLPSIPKFSGENMDPEDDEVAGSFWGPGTLSWVVPGAQALPAQASFGA